MAERNLDEYKSLAFYKKHTVPKRAGFSKFDVDGEYYFCRYSDDKVCLISQAYKAASGRDNGIASVRKNGKISERYRVENRDNGKHGFSLRAGNGQEIGISPNYGSRKAAEHIVGRLSGKIKTAKATAPKNIASKKMPSQAKPTPKKTRVKKAAAAGLVAGAARGVKSAAVEQDYKPLAFYQRQTKGRKKGIETFTADNGKHYFAYFENGKIALISEGYPTKAARDTGVASVEKNIGLEKRYHYRGPLKNGKYDYRLRAGNHKEIARSVWYSSAATAATGAAYLVGTRKRTAKRKMNAAAPAAAALAAGATAKAASAKPAAAKPTLSKPKTQKVSTPVVPPKAKPKAVTPKAAPKPPVPKVEPKASVPIAAVAGAPLAAAAIVAAKVVPPKASVPEVPPMKAAVPVLSTAKVATPAIASTAGLGEGGGIWGWLKWLLMAMIALLAIVFLFKNCSGGDTKVATPKLATIETESAAVSPLIACWDGSKAETRSACPTKITCWNGDNVKSRSDCPVEPRPTVTCWDGSTVEALSNCPVELKAEAVAKPAPKVPAARPAPKPSVATFTRGTISSNAGATAGIFAAGTAPVVVRRLGTNPEFGDSRALGATAFYNKLNARYAASGFDRKYLDYLARELGYSGWGEVTAADFTETSLAHGTTGVLGYGSNHAYQYSKLDVTDVADLDAFQLASKNGRTVYFMKRCGNYFFPT